MPARANNSNATDIFGRQMSRGNGASRGRSHVCEPAFVVKHQFEMSRLLTEYQDHAIRKRHAEFLVVVESGRHFQNVHIVALDVAILDMDIARRFLEI